MLEDVFDLRGTIEGQPRKLGVHHPRDTERMRWSIQEVRITEGDMLGPRLLQTSDILQDNLWWDNEKSTAVDRWDGAMQTVVLTATAGLDISDASPDAIVLQLCVSL